MPNLLLPLSILLQFLFGEARAIYFLDTTKLSICYSMREKRNKLFGKIAEKGKTSMGWFFGFKLHMIIYLLYLYILLIFNLNLFAIFNT